MLPKNFPVFVAEKKQLVFTPSIMTALPVIVEIAGRLRYHHTNTRSRNDYFKTPPQSLNISLAETFYLWLTRARCSGCADEGSPHWRTCAREVHLVCVVQVHSSGAACVVACTEHTVCKSSCESARRVKLKHPTDTSVYLCVFFFTVTSSYVSIES